MEEHPKARDNQLLVEEVGNEFVVYDLKRGEVHLLNPVAALVWRSCDGRTTVAELAALLQDKLGPSATEDLVRLALDELGAEHLLEEARPFRGMLSRQEAIKKLAAVAGVGLALPIVETMKAPPARAAASLPRECSGTCGAYPDCRDTGGECEDGCDCKTDKKAKKCVCKPSKS
jgi:Coenzyme PQQ synthesis protein D (PqqD)